MPVNYHTNKNVRLLVRALKVRVGCQDKLCVNSDADETQALMGKLIREENATLK